MTLKINKMSQSSLLNILGLRQLTTMPQVEPAHGEYHEVRCLLTRWASLLAVDGTRFGRQGTNWPESPWVSRLELLVLLALALPLRWRTLAGWEKVLWLQACGPSRRPATRPAELALKLRRGLQVKAGLVNLEVCCCCTLCCFVLQRFNLSMFSTQAPTRPGG